MGDCSFINEIKAQYESTRSARSSRKCMRQREREGKKWRIGKCYVIGASKSILKMY